MMVSKGLGAGSLANESALDENALGEAWADLGASFGVNASTDRMSFSLRSLTYSDLLAQATQLSARQLAAPSFPADVWVREREAMPASIREANTRPATVAGRAFNQAVYGKHRMVLRRRRSHWPISTWRKWRPCTVGQFNHAVPGSRWCWKAQRLRADLLQA
jgi:hypothetical protein